MIKNAILLAGGNGARLAPLTSVVNKHLLGVNGKFVIDYPINTLKQMGIENVTIVLGGSHYPQVVGYLQDGSRYEMNFNYVFQGEPKGIAHAIDICQSQTGDDNFVTILGDNFFENDIKWSVDYYQRAQVVLHKHPKLNCFGVASVLNNKIVKIVEKPDQLDSKFDNYAVSGCYLFTPEYFEFFKEIKKSARNEYEIVDIINKYNELDKLSFTIANSVWSDLGTHKSIANINNYLYNKDFRY